ncbi:MAG: hypothetical protein JWR50_2002 [Mucilaginibacter sp.]|nr:hypothetical protein [Mucilaginibacter sp.]
MTKQQFWGYPGLCVCLFFCCVLISCTVKRQDNVVQKQSRWELLVWLKAKNEEWNIPVDNDEPAPFKVERLKGPVSHEDFLLVGYRLANLTKTLELKEKLLAAGNVVNIKITTYPY